MIDEMFPKSRALIAQELRRFDRGSLDETAFEAACNAYCDLQADPRIEKTIRQRIAAAIEAYEAALWRPLEEAPRDGGEVLVSYCGCQYIGYWDEADGVNGMWAFDGRDDPLSHQHMVENGAMFRTITPFAA